MLQSACRAGSTVVILLLVLGSTVASPFYAAEAGNAALERKFSQTVRPFLTSYCIGCHSGATPAAQFDLRPYTTIAASSAIIPHWDLVLEKLDRQGDAAQADAAAARRRRASR